MSMVTKIQSKHIGLDNIESCQILHSKFWLDSMDYYKFEQKQILVSPNSFYISCH
jgi:hypothetical protein